MKLIQDWRKSHKLWSMRLNAFGAAVGALAAVAPGVFIQLWASFPPTWRDMVDRRLLAGMVVLFFVVSGIARLLRQKGIGDETNGA